jgi:predicted permease
MSALGIGANTAIFSVVHHLILAPLPYVDGDRMVTFTMTSGGGAFLISPRQHQIDLWRSNTHTAESIIPINHRRVIIGDTAVDAPRQAFGVSTIPGALAFLGARAVIGRDLTADDTLGDAAPVALISSALWQSDYGERKNVLGTQIRIDGATYTIIGVLPPGFNPPFTISVTTDIVEPLRHTGGDRPVSAIAKLRKGTTVDEANRELAALFAVSGEAQRSDRDAHTPDVVRRGNPDVPSVESAVDLVGESLRRIVIVLFGAVGLVLLIACANVANLMLSRAWSRQREFAVRIAMGAGRARVVRQVLTESAMLAVAGGALGLLVAQGTLRGMIAMKPPNAADLFDVRLEPAVLGWSLAVSVVTGLLFGTAPALFASRANVSDCLKSSSRSASASRASRRFRGALVMVEIALSVVLVAGAGLLVRSLVAMQQWNVGFVSHELSGMPLVLIGSKFTEPARREVVLHQMLDEMRAVPGVQSVALAAVMPPAAVIGTGGLQIDGVSATQTDSVTLTAIQAATPEFFKVAGIRLTRGRLFPPNPAQNGLLRSDEILISESFAQRFWPGGDPLGARLRSGTGDWARIVGVVADVTAPGNQGRDRRKMIYYSLAASPNSAMLIVRSALSPPVLAAAIRKAAHRADPSLKLRRDLIVADQALASYSSFRKFLLAVLSAFAVLALVLAVIGLYGVIAYGVSQRTREIGVRLALGAERDSVILMFVREGLKLSASGILIGSVLAVAATRVLRDVLFGVRPGDPLTLATVAAILGIVAVVAVYAPARRAASIDPVEALRAE